MSEEHLLICGPPYRPRRIPGSVKKPCIRCGRTVWVAPSGQRALAADQFLRVICTACFPTERAALDPNTRCEGPVPGGLEEVIQCMLHQHRN